MLSLKFVKHAIDRHRLKPLPGACCKFSDGSNAYYNRGNLKQNKLNDPQGALADYNQAIRLKPNLANAYGARGLLKYTVLNDRSGGIVDMRKAAELAKAQGNTQLLNFALQTLQSWGVK
jgi:tetratricopeptide (TPR) repeat protein